MKQVFIGTVVAASILWSGTALGEEGNASLRHFAKCEADLWEGVSAVYSLIADSGNLAKHAFAAEFKEELEEFEDAIRAVKKAGRLQGALELQVARIEEHWSTFKATGEALVEQALRGEKAEARNLAKFWQTADAIDEHLDQIIEDLSYPES